MVSSTTPATVRAKAGAIFRVTSGNFLEQFDFFLFGFYATYIAHTFFPASSEFASLMMTFAVFGAGFLMRPIGAIVLGAYIDKVGRRKGLIVTLSIMAAGTFLIVLIPSYQSIGLWAPLLVLTGRLLQGFSAGAELGGVSVYLAEIATPGRKGFYTSWQSGSQQVAIMIAAAMGFALNVVLEESAIREWGWRIPFLFGCLIVPFIFFLRRKLEETEEFSARRHHLAMRQVFTTLLANWPVVVAGMLMVAMTTTAFYLITVYAPTFGKKVLMLSASDSLLVTLLVAVSNFIWLPVGGALSDRFGREPVLIAMTLLALATSYPALTMLAAVRSAKRRQAHCDLRPVDGQNAAGHSGAARPGRKSGRGNYGGRCAGETGTGSQDGGGLPRGAGGFARRDGRQSGRAGAGYQYGACPAANAAEGALHGLFRQRQRPVC